MKRYQLAKLVEWAGTLESRKRMQKVIFMLKAKGCSLDADFILHRYGPYSSDVARLTDEMVRYDLLDELETDNGMGGVQYEYELSVAGETQLQDFKNLPQQSGALQEMEQFEPLAKELLGTNLWELEVASTIVYYRQLDEDWDSAKSKAFQFKNVDSSTEFASQAETLARTILN